MANAAFRGTLQDIRLFVAACEEGSFTAAGLRENTAQSGVSQHIRNLEDAYGVRLFLREKSKVIPTPAAEAVYRHCVTVLRELGQTANELRRYSKARSEHITIGIIPALNRRCIAGALLQFEENYPNVKIRIVEGMSLQFPGMVKSREIDFALGIATPNEKGIRTTPVVSIPDCLVARRQPADHDSIMVNWPQSPLKVCWPSGGYGRRDALAARLAELGLSVSHDREVDSAFTTLDFVCRSEWVTIAPAILLDPEYDADRYSVRPLGADLQFKIELIEEKTTPMTQAAKAFVELMQNRLESAVSLWQERFAAALI